MDIFVEFDCYADIIEVPHHIGIKINKYRNRFLDWIYDPKNNHGYWVNGCDANGYIFKGVQYGIDAFVDWLNKYVCKKEDEKASVKMRNLDISSYEGEMRKIFF